MFYLFLYNYVLFILDPFLTFSNFKIFNLGLLNILGFYHPLFLFLVIYHVFRVLKKNFFLIKKVQKKNNINFSLSVLTFFLGSYWAGQELLWGGFWNWDLVELTLLLLTLSMIFSFHFFFLKFSFFKTIFFFSKITIFTLFLYFIVNRSPLIISQHLFSSSFFFKLDRHFFIFLFITIFINVIYFFFKQKKNKLLIYLFCLVFLFYLLFFVFIYWNYFTRSTLFINKLFFKILILYIVIFICLWFYSWLLCLTSNYVVLFLFFLILKYWKHSKKPIFNLKHTGYLIFILFYLFYFISKLHFNDYQIYKFFVIKKSVPLHIDFFQNSFGFNLKRTNLSTLHQVISFSIFIFYDSFLFLNTIFDPSTFGNRSGLLANVYWCSFGFFHCFFFFLFSKLVVFLKTKY